ncbi:MAG TPA: ATP-binding cassette domain-containing protein [Saprospiraceae bacterium]|nr:ATP-binding cassette domain-containing protein [Saprospiraceae bacterium]
MQAQQVICENIAKRFQYEWVFKELSCLFTSEHIYGILGPNGAGKSTFLKVISGFTTPTRGIVKYVLNDKDWTQSNVYANVGYCAPYIDLIEEMTVLEMVKFNHVMRPFPSIDLVIEGIKQFPFRGILTKRIIELSSGMKQRVKLILAIMSGSAILLLDEPGSNLDTLANVWWQELLVRHRDNRLILIASNDPQDLKLCTSQLDITSYKNFDNKLLKNRLIDVIE